MKRTTISADSRKLRTTCRKLRVLSAGLSFSLEKYEKAEKNQKKHNPRRPEAGVSPPSSQLLCTDRTASSSPSGEKREIQEAASKRPQVKCFKWGQAEGNCSLQVFRGDAGGADPNAPTG